jgi:Lysyl oxidase
MARKNYLRTSALALAAIVATVVALLMAYTPAGAATDVLPDLGMARLENLQIQSTSSRKLLRFDTIIVNVGDGAFEARGLRSSTRTSMTVTQRIYNDAGGYRDLPTTAQMYFAGDGHTHWHLRDLQTYELRRLDNGVKVGTGAKHGFCFFDNYRFGSKRAAYYKGCGNNPDALEVRMGLSRGWGDRYGAGIVDQYIDVTGLTSGRYKLRATADADNWFSESNNSNNFTWVDIQISGTSVSVIRYGPAAQPI